MDSLFPFFGIYLELIEVITAGSTVIRRDEFIYVVIYPEIFCETAAWLVGHSPILAHTPLGVGEIISN